MIERRSPDPNTRCRLFAVIQDGDVIQGPMVTSVPMWR